MRACKAVSEVLGYILVLAIVVATITVIYAAGMPAVRSQQDIAVFRSMENTFYILQNVERLVAYNITPEKAVTVRAEGGSIAVISDYITFREIQVVGIKQGGNEVNRTLSNVTYGAIVYIGSSGNRGLVLDNGAVLFWTGDKIQPLPANLKYVGNVPIISTRIFRIGNNVYISIINVTGELSFSGQKMIIFKNINSEIKYYPNAKMIKIWKDIIVNEKARALGINTTELSELWRTSIMRCLNGSIPGNSNWIQIRPNPSNARLNVTIAIYNITVSG